MRSTTLALSMVVLVSGLVFPPLAAYTTVYVTMLAMLAGMVLFSSRNWDVLGLTPYIALWLALVLSLIAFFAVGPSIGNFGAVAVLLPVLIAPGIIFLLREEPQFTSPQVIGSLCLIGAFASVGIAINDVYFEHMTRAGGGNNPIHFGGISLVIGFMALLGLFGTRSLWRFFFLLGPVLGMAAAVLSGSRGPVVAGIVLFVFSVPCVLVWFRRERATWAFFVTGLLGAGLALQLLNVTPVARVMRFVPQIPAIFGFGGWMDNSSEERLVFFSAAWNALKKSPVFGYGSNRITEVTKPYFPSEFQHLNNPHLHSDPANFAVAAGLFGIAAYALLLLAPLLVFRIAQDKDMRRAVLLGGIMLSVGYFVLGLTNAMFGILPQTVLYGLLLGLLVAIALEGRALADKSV